MKLFKKEEEKKCCCGGNCSSEAMSQAQAKLEEVAIKVLGTGCKKCETLETNAKHAVYELGISIPVIHVNDFNEIAAYGVMSTPALVVNEEVVSFGKVLTKEEIKAILENKGVK